ncbi:glutamate-5-semialdehyde dehydrogenase [candidate division KSB1 bacterium]|nr:glutamate-5-semialdehyde dehydrogenase [candidate division KSB1 bacterium]
MNATDIKIKELARACKVASRATARLTTAQKNQALHEMAAALMANEKTIVSENAKDVKHARTKQLSSAMIDRLVLNHDRLTKMADALREIAMLPDPVGEISDIRTRPSEIQVGMMRIPLGVIAMIYESRPNVTSDAAGLCLKSGNAVLLRGGSEAFHSNTAITAALHQAMEKVGIPATAITLVPTTDRAIMNEMLTLDESIDLVIPRGGEGLIRFVVENSRIPVIKHYKGVCHQYVDKSANFDKAINLLVDGKTSRPGVCNALETLLVHKDIAAEFLPKAAEYMNKLDVELRGCEKTCKILPNIVRTTNDDYATEYLELIIAVRVVDDYEMAVSHIQEFGSDHTEVIVTEDLETAQKFLRDVNSSVVTVNASSRFSDGGELGLGAEIGISTTKLHAFGPMGLESLTTRKFIVVGKGEVRHPQSKVI